MKIRRPLFVLTVLAALAAPAHAQTLDQFFDPQVLQEVRLYIHSTDLATLKQRITEDTYYPADFEWRGIRVRNVGVRNRGLGSRNPFKLGLRVEFDHYATDQNFFGLRNLVLRNLWQDKSFIHETVAMAFITKVGQPASRESFAKVYINNVYSGVYAVVENVDTAFLQRTLGNNTGYLFEYRYKYPFYATDLGDDLATYRLLFEPENPHKKESDTVLYTPIRNLLREVNRPVDEAWRAAVNSYINLEQFVTYIAIDNFLAEEDGLLGNFGMNNFYLYREASGNQHRVLPWDKSETFYVDNFEIFRRVDQNVLATGALSFSDLRSRYLDVLQQCADAAAEQETPDGPSWLEREFTRDSDLIREAVYADPLKQFTNEEFDQEIERLKRFARLRSSFVTAEVAKQRTP